MFDGDELATAVTSLISDDLFAFLTGIDDSGVDHGDARRPGLRRVNRRAIRLAPTGCVDGGVSMKRMLPVEELARDSRFQHIRIEDTVFDPRNLNPAASSTVSPPTTSRPATTSAA